MFRDIEYLEPGDEVRVTNPWGTLTDRVRETKVIAPNDSSDSPGSTSATTAHSPGR